MAVDQTEATVALQPVDREMPSGTAAQAEPAVCTESAGGHETEGTGLVDSPPALLQRVLLTTDGSVGRILENYAGEAIEAVKLEQFQSAGGEVCHPLELAAEDERLTRRVLLRGSQSGRSLLYADTLVALDRLHPLVRSGLLSTSEPIGRLLTTARTETFRDILSAGRVRAGVIGAHFAIDDDDELFVRTYRIVCGGRPVMLITEKFPTTWFC